jgi:hypothetical protein
MLSQSVKFNRTNLAGNRTLTNAADNGRFLNCDTAAADRNIYVPIDWAIGNMLYIKNAAGANKVIVSGVIAIMFQDGTSTLEITAGQSCHIFCTDNLLNVPMLTYYIGDSFIAEPQKNNLNFTTYGAYLDIANFADTTSGSAALSDFTFAYPTINDTLITRTTTDTLTNKTFTSPILSTIPIIASLYGVAAGSLITVPTPSAGDLLVLLATAQSPTNKTFTSTCYVNQSNLRSPVTTVTAGGGALYEYTVLATSSFLDVNATNTGAFDTNVNLPQISASIYGKNYVIRKNDASANVAHITPFAGDSIDGGATVDLAAQWDSSEIVCAGPTRWSVLH